MIPAGADLAARVAADRHGLVERFERAARQARRRTDPEAVHDVRVATRQLEAALDLWRSVLPPRRRRRARRALRQLRRALGPAREARICLKLLNERMGGLAPEARVAAGLVQSLLQRRLERLEGRAARRCARDERERLRSRFERAWEGTAPIMGPGTFALESARARLQLRRARARDTLRDAIKAPGDERFHAARLAVKRWRYVLERFAAAEPDTDRSEQRWLRSVQETLGRIQDLAVLRDCITRMYAPDTPAEPTTLSAGVRGLLIDFEAERARCVSEFGRLAATVAHAPPVVLEPRRVPRWGEG